MTGIRQGDGDDRYQLKGQGAGCEKAQRRAKGDNQEVRGLQ